MNRNRKRALIAQRLRETPQVSNRQIARDLECDDKTVATMRAKLESTAEIPQLDKTVGADGKERPRGVERPAVPAATASDSDIEARRSTLQRELWEVGHRLGMPTSEAQRARNDRMAELQAQLDALPKPQPRETGEAAGIVQIGSFLGSPWSAPPREPNETDRRRDEDPYLRFMRESGEAWE